MDHYGSVLGERNTFDIVNSDSKASREIRYDSQNGSGINESLMPKRNLGLYA